jgi:DNA-binding NarL/FixJ family response regulator
LTKRPEAADDPNRTVPVRRPPAEWRILIVDDHPLVRRGLKALIDGEPDLMVCGEAATHRAGLEAVASTRPDLVIADLSLGDGDGLETVREIRAGHRDLPVLVLSMHDLPVYAERALRAGAGGYVSKQEMGEVVLVGVRRLLGGGRFLSPKMKSGRRSPMLRTP